MKLLKKLTSIVTILSTFLVSLLLIMLIFDVKMFGANNSKMLITFATLSIGGFFAINSLNMFSKNKMISFISLGLIIASVVLIIFSTWIKVEGDMYFKITVSLGLLSVLFNIIVSSGLDLGKTKLVWQIAVYLIVGLTDLITTLAIFGVINLLYIIPWFLTLIILSIVGVIILKVLAKKVVSDIIEDNKNMIKISKEEYNRLLEKASKYDELIKNKQD